MSIPLKRVVLSTSALAIVAGPSIVAAQAATHPGATSAKTTGPDRGQDTRSAGLWFTAALDSHRGAHADDSGATTPTTTNRLGTMTTGAHGGGDDYHGRGSSPSTSDDPTTVTSVKGVPSPTRPTTTTTMDHRETTTTGAHGRGDDDHERDGSPSTSHATTTVTSVQGPTPSTRPTTTTTGATTTTTQALPTTTAAPTTTTTAAAKIRLSQTFLATTIGNSIQLSTSISNDATTPAAITLTVNVTTSGLLPGRLYPSSKPAYLSCSPSEIQNPSPTGTFTCTGSVPAATTGAVVISSGSVIAGTAGTPVNSTASAAGVTASASSTYS